MTMIKPGHTSLDMDDLSEDLVTVRHHVKKLDTKYRVNNDIEQPVRQEYYDQIQNADDTDLVAGIKADNIAIAIGSGNRKTINNSLHFEGHSWDEVMNKSEGDSLTKRTESAINNYGQDIADLRDEVYQLRHELEKKGLVGNIYEHLGYNDVFRNGYKPYEYKCLGQPTENSTNRTTLHVSESVADQFDKGDYIVIYYKDVGKADVCQIKDISANNEVITLDEAMSSMYNIAAKNIEIYKSYGISRNGNFYIARDTEHKISDREYWSGLDDDSYFTTASDKKVINSTGQAYAYSFRIPEKKMGYLTTFSIQVDTNGNHGTPTLGCCIIDEEDIANFRNPEQAEALYKAGDLNSDGEPKMKFFAKATPVQLEVDRGVYDVNFDFWNAAKDSYPMLTRKDVPGVHKVRYVAVIYAVYANKDNYVRIVFMHHGQDVDDNSDLQKNNTVYIYTRQEDASTTPALSTTKELNEIDMYYGVTLHEVLTNAMESVPRGLYTADIKCSYPKGVSHARLTLRFAREGGRWNAVNTEPNIYGSGTVLANFNAECTPKGSIRSTTSLSLDNRIRKPIENRTAASDVFQMPDLIVGNNLTKGVGSETMITPESPIYVVPGDMAYRNAFIVSVKGKFWQYDQKLQKYVVKNKKKIYLKPIAVIRDGGPDKNDDYSDRVIFEGDFTDENGNAMFFNQLELQIYWENSNFSDTAEIRKKQMGIIHDLIFSTDSIVH